jgi:hypothetical protein
MAFRAGHRNSVGAMKEVANQGAIILRFHRPVTRRAAKIAAILGLDPKAFGDAFDLYSPRQLIFCRKHGNAARLATAAT